MKNSKPIAVVWKSPTTARISWLELSGFERSDVRYCLSPGFRIILIEYVTEMKLHVNIISLTPRMALFEFLILMAPSI